MIALVHFCPIYRPGSDLKHCTVFQVDDSVKRGLTSWNYGDYSLDIRCEIWTAGNLHMWMLYLPMWYSITVCFSFSFPLKCINENVFNSPK